MVVNFAVLILLLRRVRRSVRFLQEPIIEDELVRAFGRATSGLAGLIATPRSHEESQRREPVRSWRALLRAGWNAQKGDRHQYGNAVDSHVCLLGTYYTTHPDSVRTSSSHQVSSAFQPIRLAPGYMLVCEITATGRIGVDIKTHWERVYSTKRSDEVSWYQANPAPSLQLLENAGSDPNT